MILLLPLDGLTHTMHYCTLVECMRLRATSRGLRDALDGRILCHSIFCARGATISAEPPEALVWLPTDMTQLKSFSEQTRQRHPPPRCVGTFVMWAYGSLRGAVSRYLATAVHWPSVHRLILGWGPGSSISEASLCTLLRRIGEAAAQPSHITLSVAGSRMKTRFACAVESLLSLFGVNLHSCIVVLRDNLSMPLAGLQRILRAITGLVRQGSLAKLHLDLRGMRCGHLAAAFAGVLGCRGQVCMITDTFAYEWEQTHGRLALTIQSTRMGYRHAVERVIWSLREFITDLTLDLSSMSARVISIPPGPLLCCCHSCPGATLWSVATQLQRTTLSRLSIHMDACGEDVPMEVMDLLLRIRSHGCLELTVENTCTASRWLGAIDFVPHTTAAVHLSLPHSRLNGEHLPALQLFENVRLHLPHADNLINLEYVLPQLRCNSRMQTLSLELEGCTLRGHDVTFLIGVINDPPPGLRSFHLTLDESALVNHVAPLLMALSRRAIPTTSLLLCLTTGITSGLYTELHDHSRRESWTLQIKRVSVPCIRRHTASPPLPVGSSNQS